MLRIGSDWLCQGWIQGIWKGGSYSIIDFKIIFLPILELFSAVAHSKMPLGWEVSVHEQFVSIIRQLI